MADLRMTQLRSANGTNPKQRAALHTLGLGRIGKASERPDEPTVQGAPRKIEHLVRIER